MLLMNRVLTLNIKDIKSIPKFLKCRVELIWAREFKNDGLKGL